MIGLRVSKSQSLATEETSELQQNVTLPGGMLHCTVFWTRGEKKKKRKLDARRPCFILSGFPQSLGMAARATYSNSVAALKSTHLVDSLALTWLIFIFTHTLHPTLLHLMQLIRYRLGDTSGLA